MSDEKMQAIAHQLRAYAKTTRRWLEDPEITKDDMKDLAKGLERQADRLEGKK